MILSRCKLSIVVALLLLSIGCTSSKLEYQQPQNTVSIAHLKSLCKNQTYYIDSDLSISGRVTANDLFGEYYKSIVIEDESGGIEVAIDKEKLYNDIPIDSRVTILCTGLALGKSGSKVELGMNPTGEYSVDGIDRSMLHTFIIIDRTPQKREPKLCTIDQIGAKLISSTVHIEALRIEDPHCTTWCESIGGETFDTEHIAVDRNGQQLKIRVRGSCHYANTPLPEGRFAVCGIIDYAAGAFYLRPTNKSIICE